MKRKIMTEMSNTLKMIDSKGCLKRSKDCLSTETRQYLSLSNHGRKSANNVITLNLSELITVQYAIDVSS